MTITPSVIIRRKDSSVVDIPDMETGEPALLVFASPEMAEEFRAVSRRYTKEEGFAVMPSSAHQLRVVLWGHKFKSVAVRGAEPEDPDGVLFYEPADFMLEFLGSEYDPENPLS